jgi:hypothetical protein
MVEIRLLLYFLKVQMFIESHEVKFAVLFYEL